MKRDEIKPGWYRGGKYLTLRRVHVVGKSVIFTIGLGDETYLATPEGFARWAKKRVRVKAAWLPPKR